MLGNRDHIFETGRVAINSSRRREDNVGDIVFLHGPKKRDGATDVHAVVFERNLGRFSNSLKPRDQSVGCVGVFWLCDDIHVRERGLALRAAK